MPRIRLHFKHVGPRVSWSFRVRSLTRRALFAALCWPSELSLPAFTALCGALLLIAAAALYVGTKPPTWQRVLAAPEGETKERREQRWASEKREEKEHEDWCREDEKRRDSQKRRREEEQEQEQRERDSQKKKGGGK